MTITVTLRDAASNNLTSNGSEVVAATIQSGPNSGGGVTITPMQNADGT